MLYSRLSRLKHLEDADLKAHGQLVILRIQYAATDTKPATWGPSYAYRLPAGVLAEEEASDET